MADINPVGIVDNEDSRRIYFPTIPSQGPLDTPQRYFQPNSAIPTFTPQLPGSEARFIIPTTNEKYRLCQVFFTAQPTLVFLNSVTGLPINMRVHFFSFFPNLLFDGQAVTDTFLNEKEVLYVPPGLKQIVLGVSTGRFKFDPVNALPENGINNTHIDFPLNTAASGQGYVIIRPWLLFQK